VEAPLGRLARTRSLIIDKYIYYIFTQGEEASSFPRSERGTLIAVQRVAAAGRPFGRCRVLCPE